MGKSLLLRSKMKSSPNVTSSRRKNRRAHFQAPSHLKYKLMSVHLSKEMREKHAIRCMPVRKDDEVMIVRGKNKGHSGKVTDVYRRRWCLYIDGLSKNKPNGQPVRVPIDASNCVLTKIKLTKDRQDLIVRKARNSAKLKGKTTEKEARN